MPSQIHLTLGTNNQNTLVAVDETLRSYRQMNAMPMPRIVLDNVATQLQVGKTILETVTHAVACAEEARKRRSADVAVSLSPGRVRLCCKSGAVEVEFSVLVVAAVTQYGAFGSHIAETYPDDIKWDVAREFHRACKLALPERHPPIPVSLFVAAELASRVMKRTKVLNAGDVRRISRA